VSQPPPAPPRCILHDVEMRRYPECLACVNQRWRRWQRCKGQSLDLGGFFLNEPESVEVRLRPDGKHDFIVRL
jgi:hypothetical protein